MANTTPIQGMGRLEAIVERNGRLLRVERESAGGRPLDSAGGRRSRRLRLWFDCGGVDLSARAGALVVDVAADASERLPVDAAEEEPWWALFGGPLARATARDDGSLLLQFREDHASPRILVVSAAILVVSAAEMGVDVRSLV